MPALELARASSRPRRVRPEAPQASNPRPVVRKVLWSTAFHRFYGGQVDRDRLPSDIRPLSCGQASKELASIVDVDRDPVRRCLGQMLASGYVPDRHNQGQFRDLAKHAMRPEAHSADEALERLRARGLRECGKTARGEASTRIERPAIEFVSAAGEAPPSPKVSPTVVKFSDGVFTVTTEIEVPRPYDEVSKFVGPKGWNALGPFWRAIDERWVESGDHRCDGDVYEHFVFSWNNVVENEYKVLLKATQRSKPGTMSRIDYSLVGEEHGRILVDEGYGLAVRDESRPGWTKYTGVKTLKFASSLLNLLSPAVMAMYLETQASGLQNAVLPR